MYLLAVTTRIGERILIMQPHVITMIGFIVVFIITTFWADCLLNKARYKQLWQPAAATIILFILWAIIGTVVFHATTFTFQAMAIFIVPILVTLGSGIALIRYMQHKKHALAWALSWLAISILIIYMYMRVILPPLLHIA